MTTTNDLPTLPALVVGHVSHRRRSPVRHAFRHRVYQWLVDLDDLPRYLRVVARFDPRDHLGGNAPGGIKSHVQDYLASHGVTLGPGSRVVMLANARVLGFVFDPLTAFWCFTSDGALRCVVAEVHNTYGERHAYLLEPDANHTAETDKRFYVSPFNDVSGRYTLRFEMTPHRVLVEVALRRDDRIVFTASFAGHATPATPATVARTALRMPAMPQRVAVLIRVHGVWLWLRRLAIVPRPEHHPPEGVR